MYDSAKRHFKGKYPLNLPIENSYLLLGIYLGWLTDRGLLHKNFKAENLRVTNKFKTRDITPSVLIAIFDGFLERDMLSVKGRAFTRSYYLSGQYMLDYQEVLCETLPTIYNVKDNWQNYEQVKLLLDKRYYDWITV